MVKQTTVYRCYNKTVLSIIIPLDKQTEYELIGGEVTVIPGFEDIIKCINEHNSTSIVYTNASRTVKWWSKAKQYMNSVVLTYLSNTGKTAFPRCY